MSEPSTTASTWEPDWLNIAAILCGLDDYGPDKVPTARSAIAEYQRQASSAGLAMVRREDAHYLAAVARDICDGFKPLATQELRGASNRMFDAALAATPEPAPGGDGS